MRYLQPVHWAKGTSLMPQHLQVQDRYLESLLQFQLESLANYLWGFAKLEIDQEKLAKGEFCITRVRGIFPDGLLFDVPDSDPAVSSRAIAKESFKERNRIGVYLSVPEHQESGQNIGTQHDARTRFVAAIRMVPDENSGTSSKPVQIAGKNFKLLVGDESREGSSTLKVAEIEKKGENGYMLSPEFVPPMIDIHGSSLLRGMVRSLTEMLSTRGSSLAAGRRQKNQSLAEFTASDIPRFWLLYTINQHLPVFQHLFRRQTVHPEQLYSAMLSLAGTLTTFSSTLSPNDFPGYEHDQLGKCFLELEKKIKFLLDTVVPSNCVAIPLRPVRPSVYTAVIEDEQLLRNARQLFLAISADVIDAKLVERVPQVVKAGAASNIEQMIQRALPGLPLTYPSSPPDDIPVKLKYKYFKLDPRGDVWQEVQRAQDFGVYVPAEFPNPQLELLIVLPAESRMPAKAGG